MARPGATRGRLCRLVAQTRLGKGHFTAVRVRRPAPGQLPIHTEHFVDEAREFATQELPYLCTQGAQRESEA
jgi:hypothetical protein